MASNYQLTYNVDITLVIDVTGSMSPIINTVKNNALNLYSDIVRKMEEKNKHIENLRIRVISFRDYAADGEAAMDGSDFFLLPAQKDDLFDCIHSLTAAGGGDEPENGLEALAYAIRSDWNKEGIKKRHIIVVWSDASTHPLGNGNHAPNYPAGMPKTFQDLTLWWGDLASQGEYMDQRSKRLLLFTPNAAGWDRIINEWDNIVHVPSASGTGLRDVDYDTILSSVANSI